jgi:hypothetical protein
MTTQPEAPALRPHDGILLQGGRMLLLFECDAPLPVSGRILTGDSVTSWHAASWKCAGEAGAWIGIAVVDAMPTPGSRFNDAGGPDMALLAPSAVDMVPDRLVAVVRGAGLDAQAIFAFLARHLLEGRPRDCAAARAHRAFARDFLTAMAEPDGFIEIIAQPRCGGLFLQGWSVSLASGAVRVAAMTEDLCLREVEVALFERPDLLEPARGCCLFGKGWADPAPESLYAVFFEHEGRLARLDVVPGPVIQPDPDLATQHVASMLPRLAASQETIRAFRRICRPAFSGIDTLSAAPHPVAAALDVLLEAPDGGLLASGWLLDPLGRVEMAILKSKGSFCAPIYRGWSRLPRPDIATAFADDPRFADLIDPSEVMHGFVAYAPPAARRDGEPYLELVLEDGALFLPLRVAPVTTMERVAAFLPMLAPPEPEFGEIVARHLAPFVAAIAAGSKPHCTARAPVPLAAAAVPRTCSAIMPVERWSDLQPVFGLLAGSPEAGALDLTLVMPRTLARDCTNRVQEAFDFYGLTGDLVVVPDGLKPHACLDAGLEASRGERVIAWHPSALPQMPGWLGLLMEEMEGIGQPALVSPALIYEDGSIYFSCAPLGTDGRRCDRLGFGRPWLGDCALRPVAAAAAEVALVARDALVAAGGYHSRLFTGRYAHVDLSRRLAAVGIGSWCSGRVLFWKLEEGRQPEPDHAARVLDAVDEALLSHTDLLTLASRP